VTATPSALEKLTVAVPFSVLKSDRVWIIFAVERHLNALKMNPVAFLGIALGLLDLANHAIVHGLKISFQ
jgi:hypothetical protein